MAIRFEDKAEERASEAKRAKVAVKAPTPVAEAETVLSSQELELPFGKPVKPEKKKRGR